MTEVEIPILATPREPLPTISADAAALSRVVTSLLSGSGPIAIDAERASGFRYSSRAYLIQLRRRGSGTHLIDPIDIEDFSELASAINSTTWILHSATQDLPCLGDLGLKPASLFDTEVAAKLLGKERVGLAALIEAEFELRLEKEHSAADWSTRPLPTEWLNYAALDVELLVELREAQIAELNEKSRMTWAEEEFAYLAEWQKPLANGEPWRRTSGLHQLKTPRQLGIVQALWQERDRLAQSRDKAPGRIFSDAAMIDVATKDLKSARDVFRLETLRNRSHKAHADLIWNVRNRVMQLPDNELPQRTKNPGAIPPPKAWAEKMPAAAKRWALIRPALNELATSLTIAAEVLISPEPVRQICARPGDSLLAEESMAEFFRQYNVRSWQIELTAPAIKEAIAQLTVSELTEQDQ